MVCSRCRSPSHNMASWDCPLRKSYVPKPRREKDYVDSESIAFLAKEAGKNTMSSLSATANLSFDRRNDLVFTVDETDLRLEFEISTLLEDVSFDAKLKLIRKLEAIFEEEQEELLDIACAKTK